MFDDSTASTRLAWVCLLCHVKAQGRAGRAKLRVKTFAAVYRLSDRSVEDLLQSAQKCAAIEFDGVFVTVCNWQTYQAKTRGSGPIKRGDSQHIAENPLPSTKHQAPSTICGKSPRKRDPVWDYVVDRWFGNDAKPHELPRIGKIVKALKAHDATPDEIKRRADNHETNWPAMACTPESVVKNWRDHEKANPGEESVYKIKPMPAAEAEALYREHGLMADQQGAVG